MFIAIPGFRRPACWQGYTPGYHKVVPLGLCFFLHLKSRVHLLVPRLLSDLVPFTSKAVPTGLGLDNHRYPGVSQGYTPGYHKVVPLGLCFSLHFKSPLHLLIPQTLSISRLALGVFIRQKCLVSQVLHLNSIRFVPMRLSFFLHLKSAFSV
jgi:hypothetical protein